MESVQPIEASPSERRSFFARLIDRLRREKADLAVRLDPLVTACCAGSRWAGALYYSLWSRRFHREQQAFLAGRKRYQAQCEPHEGNRWLLRRNTHRLEKGLCMRPLRKVFATDYVDETVAAYAALSTNEHVVGDADLLHWTHDVLQQYFEKTRGGDHPVIERNRERFLSLAHAKSDADDFRGPYRRDLSQPSPVGIDEFLALARRRRSVRWFESNPVPRALVDRAVEAAAYAPTACNRQAFELHLFDTPDAVQEVAAVPMGTVGYCENIPSIGVLVGRMDAFFDERDRHLIYIDGSLFAMGFVYALEAQGIASCCINWPDMEEKEMEMADLLGLKAWERPIMLIAFGYPDPEGMVPYSQKKPLDELRRYRDDLPA